LTTLNRSSSIGNGVQSIDDDDATATPVVVTVIVITVIVIVVITTPIAPTLFANARARSLDRALVLDPILPRASLSIEHDARRDDGWIRIPPSHRDDDDAM
jgi:hypothetical protein